jgi:hypothetical protein
MFYRRLWKQAEAARQQADADRLAADTALRDIARAALVMLEATGYEDSPDAILRAKARALRRRIELRL